MHTNRKSPLPVMMLPISLVHSALITYILIDSYDAWIFAIYEPNDVLCVNASDSQVNTVNIVRFYYIFCIHREFQRD